MTSCAAMEPHSPRTGVDEDVPRREFAETLAERCERRHVVENPARGGRQHWVILSGKMRACTAT